MKQKRFLNILSLLSILGWVNAAYTLWHRQKIVGGVGEGKSFCNISSVFNCDATALSKFSLFLKIPVSSWGMIFYTVLLVYSLWAQFSHMDKKVEETDKAIHSLFLISALGLIPTFYLAAISLFFLGTICLLCTITYLINVAAFIFAWQLFKTSGKRQAFLKSTRALPQGFGIVMIILVVMQLISHKVVNSIIAAADDDLDDKTLSMFVSRHLSSPSRNFNLEDAPFYGPANAPLVIVEFSDFQCPYCRRSALTLPSLIADYKDKIKVYFKNYPLDPSCNTEMKSGGHPLACLAAKTGWCVYKAKGSETFFKYKTQAFEAQAELSPSKISSIAESLGLERSALDVCINDFNTQKAISEQVAEGKAAGIEGTPAIYLNGKSLEAGFVPKIFKAVLEQY